MSSIMLIMPQDQANLTLSMLPIPLSANLFANWYHFSPHMVFYRYTILMLSQAD